MSLPHVAVYASACGKCMFIRCSNCFMEHDPGEERCPYCGYTAGAMADELFYLAPGSVLYGRYSVGQVIGSGGFGIIYKAWDNAVGMIVAIKEYYPSGLAARIPGLNNVRLLAANRTDEYNSGMQRFIEEASNMKKFAGNSKIICILDAFYENDTAYHVMEYLHGCTLEEYLKEKGKLSLEDSINIILQISSALKAVHNAKILHRDVGPDNIIIPPDYPDGDVKLIDFGAARFSANEKESAMTRIMKPGYSPPEQYEPGKKKNEQLDIYALGATLYNMLTGMKPEESTNRKINDALPSPKALNNEIPENLSDAILKAVAVDPQLRFRSVVEFEKAVTGKEKVQNPVAELKYRKKKRLVYLLSAITVVLIGAVLLGLNIMREVERTTLPDATIYLWYPLSGDEDRNVAKEAALTAIASEFSTAYTNITVIVEGIKQENYQSEIESAMRNRDKAVLFESTGLDSGVLNNTAELGGVVSGITDCYFIDKYTRYFPNKNQIPLGFNVTAVFINSELCYYEDAEVSEISTVLSSMPSKVSETGVSYNSVAIAALTDVFNGNYAIVDRNLFFDGETGVYFSDTSEYYLVRQLMPGRYKLLYIAQDSVPAAFSDLWSLMPCSASEKKAAERLLQFMMSESAQDYLHIRNQSGNLPVNMGAMEIYQSVYGDYNGFFMNTENYTFKAG